MGRYLIILEDTPTTGEEQEEVMELLVRGLKNKGQTIRVEAIPSLDEYNI